MKRTGLGWMVAMGVSLGLLGAVGRAAEAPKTNAPAATNVVVEVSIFPDKALESAVRQQVFAKRETNSPITAADVANISTIFGNMRGITNLAGLEHCKALASVDLAGNRIADLTPLKGLKQLQYVNLATNRIKNIDVLGTLPALQYIELSSNEVSDPSPLSACTNLASVYLSRNHVTSLSSLTGLPRLVTLYADGNKLKSIAGLEKLKWLTMVSLSNNEIRDIEPLTGLRAPSFLLLENNKIHDVEALYKACVDDNAGQRNFGPFLNLYLKGNRLSAESKTQLDELKKMGARVHY